MIESQTERKESVQECTNAILKNKRTILLYLYRLIIGLTFRLSLDLLFQIFVYKVPFTRLCKKMHFIETIHQVPISIDNYYKLT